MDGGTVAPSAYAGAVVIRRWLVIGSGRCPDGRLGACVMSTERAGSFAPTPVPSEPFVAAANRWADATHFTSQTFDTNKISDLEAFLETVADLERSTAAICDAEVWHAIKTAAARRIVRLESEQAFTG